jgi:hypothetical protein
MISRQEKFEKISRTIKKPKIRAEKDHSVLASQDEINENLRRAKALEELGISTSNFDGDDGSEDSDILEAMILINQGKDIPNELKEKIKNKTKRNSTDIKENDENNMK